KAPDPHAIPMKGTFTKKEYQQPDRYREQQQDKPNQLYSKSGPQLSSDMYAIQGSGKMGLGENAPFGNQFGAYAQILRNLVASKWRTPYTDAHTRPAPKVMVFFTLSGTGNIRGWQITQSRGIAPRAGWARRPFRDPPPSPPMPVQFPKDQTDIDFVFEL